MSLTEYELMPTLMIRDEEVFSDGVVSPPIPEVSTSPREDDPEPSVYVRPKRLHLRTLSSGNVSGQLINSRDRKSIDLTFRRRRSSDNELAGEISQIIRSPRPLALPTVNWAQNKQTFNMMVNQSHPELTTFISGLLTYQTANDFWHHVGTYCFTTRATVTNSAQLVRENVQLLAPSETNLTKAVRKNFERLISYHLHQLKIQDYQTINQRLNYFAALEPWFPFRQAKPQPLTDSQSTFNRVAQWWCIYQTRIPMLASLILRSGTREMTELLMSGIFIDYRPSLVNCVIDKIDKIYRIIDRDCLANLSMVVAEWKLTGELDRLNSVINNRLAWQQLVQRNQPLVPNLPCQLIYSKRIIAGDADVIYQQSYSNQGKLIYREYFYAASVKARKICQLLRDQITSLDHNWLFESFIQMQDDQVYSTTLYQRQIDALLAVVSDPIVLHRLIHQRMTSNSYSICLASQLMVKLLSLIYPQLINGRKLFRKLLVLVPTDQYWVNYNKCAIRLAEVADVGSQRLRQYLASL